MVMKQALQDFWNDESGLTSVEYMVLLALIVLVVVVGFSPMMELFGVDDSVHRYRHAGGR